MQLRVNIDARAAQAAFKRAPGVFQKQLRLASKRGLTLIQRYAVANHRFHRRGGKLEESVLLGEKGDLAKGGKVYLEKGVAIYGRRIHEGWGSEATGWKKDQFLYNAARKKANEVVALIQAAVGKAILIAGLK